MVAFEIDWTPTTKGHTGLIETEIDWTPVKADTCWTGR